MAERLGFERLGIAEEDDVDITASMEDRSPVAATWKPSEPMIEPVWVIPCHLRRLGRRSCGDRPTVSDLSDFAEIQRFHVRSTALANVR
jgi:hypothetical protein